MNHAIDCDFCPRVHRADDGCRRCDGSWRAKGDEMARWGRLQANRRECAPDANGVGAFAEAVFACDNWGHILPHSRIGSLPAGRLRDGGFDFELFAGFTVDVKGTRRTEPWPLIVTCYEAGLRADAYVLGRVVGPERAYHDVRWSGWATATDLTERGERRELHGGVSTLSLGPKELRPYGELCAAARGDAPFPWPDDGEPLDDE